MGPLIARTALAGPRKGVGVPDGISPIGTTFVVEGRAASPPSRAGVRTPGTSIPDVSPSSRGEG